MATVRRKVGRSRDGRFLIRIPAREREILRGLPDQLEELLDSGAQVLYRLFPPAYSGDAERSDEFDGLMRKDLVDRHRHDLAVLRATVDAESVDEGQLTAWLGALNSLRLGIGTALDITEETLDGTLNPDDGRYPAYALYAYLGWLQEDVVHALSESLDPRGRPDAPPPPPGLD